MSDQYEILATLRRIEAKIDAVSGPIDAVSGRMDALSSNQAHITASLDLVEADSITQRQHFAELQRMMERLQVDIRSTPAALDSIEQLNDQLQQARARTQQLHNKLTSLEDENATLRIKVESLSSLVSSLQRQKGPVQPAIVRMTPREKAEEKAKTDQAQSGSSQ